MQRKQVWRGGTLGQMEGGPTHAGLLLTNVLGARYLFYGYLEITGQYHLGKIRV